MKKRNILLVVILTLFVAACVIFIRPVPILPEEELAIHTGKVTQIFEGGTYDIVFRLDNDESTYYINRGVELGLSIEELRKDLIGQEVTMKYPEYWSIFGANRMSTHVSKVEASDRVIFSELRD